MAPPHSFRRVLVAATLFFAAGFRLAAQNVLLAEHQGKMLRVVQAHGIRPVVSVDGKLVVADGSNFALEKVEEYLPVLVSVHGLTVRGSHLNWKGSRINNEFHFRAEFKTSYTLDNVFVVLAMDTQAGGKRLFVSEVGQLEPHEAKLVVLTIPLSGSMGGGRIKLHLFANGTEVLHTNIPADRREVIVNRMIAKRIASVKDADPKPFIGPAPEYPSALLKSRTTGQVVVSLRVGSDGRVHDPMTKSATHPAFGAAALEAVREWRFLPRVKGGRPVESEVDMPFAFAPPHATTQKS